MSRRRLRHLGLFLLLVVAVCGVAFARGAMQAETIAGSLLPASAEAGTLGGDTAASAPDSAAPAKPKRQIVPDVEVVVNIPSGRLQLIEGGSVVKSYPVSVGSARYATPVGDFLLATVIFNPWWNPPPGSEWARNRKRTPPGPGNPMGRVKLHMDELIYVHGTTSEGRLGAPASHGCIRMSNTDVVDLATRLHRIADPGVSDAELEAMSKAGRNERHTVMARSIRMRVTYKTVEMKDDRLHVFPDVYGRGGDFGTQVRQELTRAGVDTALVPAPAWTRIRQGAARGGASFAVAEIPFLEPLPPLPPRETAAPRERGPRLLGRPVDASAPPPAAPAEEPAPAPDSARVP